MPEFTYKAKASPSEFIQDVITAENKTSAISRISSKGYYLLSIERSDDPGIRSKSQFSFSKKGLSLKVLAGFTRQLSDLLEGGLTIIKALSILAGQTQDKRLKSIVSQVKDFCVEGNLLSAALAKHPDVFSKLFVSMVGAGEAGGGLEGSLSYLADYCDSQLEIQSKVRSSLAYPVLMLGVGILTIVVLLTFVIPKIAGMFSDLGQNLPLPTLILISTSNLIKNYWWAGLGGVISLVFVFRRLKKNPRAKLKIDSFKLKVPLFGSLIKKIEISRFARTLGVLLANGVSVMEALEVVRGTLNNSLIKQEVKKASEDISRGATLSRAFGRSQHIPVLVVNMMAVGEESGSLAKSLFKVTKSYQRQIDSATKSMMSLLEPILILALGSIIGFIVISMLLPIFEINFLVR